MLVLETPRYDTLMFKLLRHRERSMRCDGHVYFFTTSSLEACVRLAGFSVLKREYVGRSLTLQRLLWNIARQARGRSNERFDRSVWWQGVKLKINVRTWSVCI
jgi:hypothetical protein